MKGGNTDSKAPEVQGFDYDGVERYGSVDMKGGKKGKSKSSKFSDFDFEKEWKEFETSYNQKYGGAKKRKTSSTKKKPAKKASSSTKKKPTKKGAKPKRKPQRGGDEVGATYSPAQFNDANAQMNAPSSGPFQSAYGTIKAVDCLDRNLAPYPNSSGQQTGGAKKKKPSKKPKTATKTTKPKKDSKKDSKKDTKSTGKKVSVLDKIKKFFAM